MEEVKEVVDCDQDNHIKDLESQLSNAQEEAANNKNAASILTGMIDRGECVVDEDGDILAVAAPAMG